jgi:hypothetical protein
MNANGQLLETLTHSEMFQNYERAYTEATGMPGRCGQSRRGSFRCTASAGKTPFAP